MPLDCRLASPLVATGQSAPLFAGSLFERGFDERVKHPQEVAACSKRSQVLERQAGVAREEQISATAKNEKIIS